MPNKTATAHVTISGLSIEQLQLARRGLREYAMRLYSRGRDASDPLNGRPLWVQNELLDVQALMHLLWRELQGRFAECEGSRIEDRGSREEAPPRQLRIFDPAGTTCDGF